MGRSSHRRRADAQRKQQRIHDRAHAGPSGTDPAGRYGSADAAPADGQSPLADAAMTSLVLTAATLACGPRADKVDFAVAVQALTDLETGPATAGRTTATIAELLDRYLGHLFEGGWQPADVAHAVKREWNVTASRLAVAAIAAASRRTDAATRAPQPWLAQLDDLGAYDAARGAIVGGQADYLARWARAQRLHPDEAVATGLQVLAFVVMAPKLSILIDPPSAWGATNRGVSTHAGRTPDDIDTKALKVIRALLAKAEASTFDAEAQSFTAKAQELMTRHSIDAAVLESAARGGGAPSGVESRRFHIDNPYADEKATFLSVIGSVNGVRSVWEQWAGFVTVMGFPVDLHLTDVLFTSLLVQATHASAQATADDPRQRTPSFRRAFLIAYADRIGERLTATKEHVEAAAEAQYGRSLLPILADRAAAVEAAFAEAYPSTTPMRSRRLDAAGWYAGRSAADRAHLGAGEAIDRH